MSNGILVFIEQRQGKLNKTSWEALVAGQRLAQEIGQPLSAVVLGKGVQAIASEVADKRLNQVFLVEDDTLENYTPEGYSAALQQALTQIDPQLFILSHTYQARDFAPKLAAALGKTLISDCISYKLDGSTPVFVRQIFQGKINADVVFQDTPPYLVTFQAGAFRADLVESGDSKAEVKPLAVSMRDVVIRAHPLELFKGVKQAVDLTQAEIIVAIGRGIKSQENIPIAQKLAEALGAEIAASRPICDNEWLPMDRQIGSSGQTVQPKLYIALGISGAIQHIVGMKNSRTIVAINKDPDAPIFEIADYGIVGDLFEIVPALTEEVQKLKEQS